MSESADDSSPLSLVPRRLLEKTRKGSGNMQPCAMLVYTVKIEGVCSCTACMILKIVSVLCDCVAVRH